MLISMSPHLLMYPEKKPKCITLSMDSTKTEERAEETRTLEQVFSLRAELNFGTKLEKAQNLE